MENTAVNGRLTGLRTSLVVCLVLAGVTLAVFSPSLTHQFLTYDDQQYVTENPHVQTGLSWGGVRWAWKSFYTGNWHPLTWLSHMLDWELYGARAWGHHLTNVLLHVANTVLLFLVLRRMTGALWRSACVAALFAWHPLHVQSVAWIAERKDLLAGFFWMLTLWAYGERAEGGGRRAEGKVPSPKFQVPSPRPGAGLPTTGPSCFTFHVSRWYALALLFFTLALMSKPMAVTLPFVLLLLDFWPLGRFQINRQDWSIKRLLPLLVEKLPFFIVAAGGCVLAVLAQGRAYSLVSTAGLPLLRRLGHALLSYAHYLGATFVPRHLAAYYPYPERETWPEIAGAGLLLAMISVLVLRLGRRKPYLAVGWLWFLGMLVPVIGVVQVGDQAWADRYTYLPLIGIFIIVSWGAADALGSAVGRRLRPIVAAFLSVAAGAVLIACTASELRWWHDTRALFEHALQVTQRNGRATVMVGSFRAEEGKLDEAIALYRQALRYRSDDPEAHFFLGRAFEQQGELEEAAGEYSQALWFRPLQEKTHVSLGLIRARQGQSEQAVAHYRAALACNPESATAENNLARLLHSEGKLDEAITHYSNAVRFDPTLAQAHNNLGVLLLQKGNLPAGTAQLREAVRLNPGDAQSQYNLGSALNQQEQWPAAADLLRQAAPARPQDANVQYQFALALAHVGQTREALSQYAKALLLRPDFPEALNGISWILATDPRAEFRNGVQALQMSTLACDLTARKQATMLMTLAAAQAENGQFAAAAATVLQAQTLAGAAGQAELAAQCREMNAAFEAGKAWREPVASR